MSSSERKGIFYSFMAIVLLIPLVLLVIFYSRSSITSNETITTEIVGGEVSNFVESISEDLPRVIEISGKMAVAAAIAEVTSSNRSLANASANLSELGCNGSLDGIQNPLSGNNYFTNWTGRVEARGVDYGLNVSVGTLYYTVEPYDPYNLKFSVAILVNASSATDIRFAKTYYSNAIVSIVGFEDPLYDLNTGGTILRTITPNVSTVSGPDAVDDAFINKYYIPADDAPSFLDRLEGRLTPSYATFPPSVIGLETFVDTDEIFAQTGSMKENQSVVDHLYFSPTRFNACPIRDGDYPRLRLDLGHAGVYGVDVSWDPNNCVPDPYP